MAAIRIISKQGHWQTRLTAIHCLQYMAAIPSAFGVLTAKRDEDAFHGTHPIIDEVLT